MTEERQSWAYGSWDVTEKANMVDAASMTFTQKVEWLEKTARLVRELKPAGKHIAMPLCVRESK